LGVVFAPFVDHFAMYSLDGEMLHALTANDLEDASGADGKLRSMFVRHLTKAVGHAVVANDVVPVPAVAVVTTAAGFFHV
jgi:hypothetical protein